MDQGVDEEEVIRAGSHPGHHCTQHPGHTKSISYFRKADSVSPAGACSVGREDESLVLNSKQPSGYLASQWQGRKSACEVWCPKTVTTQPWAFDVKGSAKGKGWQDTQTPGLSTQWKMHKHKPEMIYKMEYCFVEFYVSTHLLHLGPDSQSPGMEVGKEKTPPRELG